MKLPLVEVLGQDYADANQYRALYLPEYMKSRRAESEEAREKVKELIAAAAYVCQRTNGEVNGYSRLNAALIACTENDWDPVQGEPI